MVRAGVSGCICPRYILGLALSGMTIPELNLVNIRLSHPNLYKGIVTFAVIHVALALNFFFANPTFNPYGFDKNIVGAIFLILGVSKIIFLVIYRSLQAVRFVMAADIAFMVFWGVGSSITFFTGQTSLQLFVLYLGMSVSELFLLLEPPANPVAGRKE